MMRKQYSYYEYEAFKEHNGWAYRIFNTNPDYKFWVGTDLYRESNDFFETQQEAEFAAVGHISLLENGEG